MQIKFLFFFFFFFVKTMFLNRLASFKINPSNKYTGFIEEIDKILQKYQLSHILSSYLQDGVLPGKTCVETHD